MKRMKFDRICDWNEISSPKTRALESIKTKSYAKTKFDSENFSLGMVKVWIKYVFYPSYNAFDLQIRVKSEWNRIRIIFGFFLAIQ